MPTTNDSKAELEKRKQEKLLAKQDQAIKILLDRVSRLEAENKRLNTAINRAEADIRTIASWVRRR